MSAGEFDDLMVHVAVKKSRTTGDGYGKPTYGTAVDIACRWETSTTEVRSPSGDEVTSQERLLIVGDPGITYNDEITLPDGRTPPIVAIKQLSDENPEVHNTVVYF